MKKLLFILSLFFIITSCDKTPIITLSVDKSEISADGKDFATFKVISTDKNNNEDDVTNNCQIFFADSKLELEGTSFSTTEPNSYSFYATYEDAVSENVTVIAIEVEDENGNEEQIEAPIILSASTDTIIANGEDAIAFTVMQDSTNITNSTEIFVNDNLIEGNEFKTNVAGSYKVYAKKNDSIVSNEITFFAKEVENNDENNDEESPIILSASKTKIVADGKDKITFTVKQDDKDITNDTKIYVGENKLRLNVFTSKTAGTYIAYAMKGELKSNEITITVENENEEPENPEPEEKPIVLSASKTNIVANGTDVISFTVKQDDKDVTSETEIYVNNNKINGNSFTTTVAGSYKAYAKKGELKSNEININATAVVEPEKPIVLSASTTNIVANGSDAVTFTVMQENNDVTSQASIFVNNQKLASNKFSTYTAGTYTAYAKKNDAISNEITITVEALPDMGKTVVFAEGVSLTSGWYDVNKLNNGGGDINMCWAASASNIIQWWQDRYVEAGNTLPAGAVTGPGTKIYPEGYKYNLALMELYRDLWWNGKGGSTDHGVIWYFEGRNIQQYASEGSLAQPNDNAPGGYFSNDWNKILQKVYHEYSYLSFSNLIAGEFNNYSIWGNGSGLQGNARMKKFSDLVVEFIDRGVTSFVISLNSNGGLLHATTLWGYEIDNATGMLTKVWITDSDDMHQSGAGDPTQQKLQEYSVSFDGSKVKLTGAPYGNCWAISLLPVSGYNSAK